MPKTKISEFDIDPANNTDINSINIAEGCAPSGINNAIRQLMSDLKDLQAGTSGDTIPIAAGGTGSTTASAARTALGLAIGTNVQAYSANLAGWSGVATSAKQDALVSGTNIKTINSTSLLGSGDITTGDVTTSGTQTLTNKTLTMPVINGTIVEDVFTITDGAGFSIDPTNGSIQLITLGASRTPTVANFDAGESVTLMVNDGTAYTITWSTIGVVWVGGSAPTLATSGFTVIALWKVGTTIYGALVGSVA
jgi:hypothetical protein